MTTVTIPVIETERLLLRGPGSADVDSWAAFLGDPEFTRYVPTSRVVRAPHERAERQITTYQRRWEEQPLNAMGWSATLKSDGQFIGLCGIESVPDTADGEIDYFFGKSYWGRGFATEVARAMIRFGLTNTAWNRIVAYIVPANIASVRVIERLGFVYEKDVNYLELAGNPDLILEPPIVALYALPRDQFEPGDALYRVTT